MQRLIVIHLTSVTWSYLKMSRSQSALKLSRSGHVGQNSAINLTGLQSKCAFPDLLLLQATPSSSRGHASALEEAEALPSGSQRSHISAWDLPSEGLASERGWPAGQVGNLLRTWLTSRRDAASVRSGLRRAHWGQLQPPELHQNTGDICRNETWRLECKCQ